MGRPLKTGLDFFGMDIDMDEDDKIIDFLEKIGTNTGMGAIWQLLNAIYKQGYYIEWNSSILKKLCRKKHLDKNEMETAVQYLTGSNMTYSDRQENAVFFNHDLYKDYKILTSKGIQKRYLLACARRSKINFDSRFIVLDYSEQTNPHKERMKDGKFDFVDTKGYWTELDNKFYLLNFITNGLLCDNTNGVNVNTNNNNDNNNTAQTELIKSNGIIVNKSTQKTVKDIDSKGQYIDIDSKGKEKESRVFVGFNSATPNIDTLINHWNSKSNLPHCRFLSPNLSLTDIHRQVITHYSQDEIIKAIDNYSETIARDPDSFPMKYKEFKSFLSKGVTKFSDEALKANKKQESNTIPVYISDKPLTDKELQERDQVLEESGGLDAMMQESREK